MSSPPTPGANDLSELLPMPLGKDEREGLRPVVKVLPPLLVLPSLAAVAPASARLAPPIEIINIFDDEEIDWDLLEKEIDEEEGEQKRKEEEKEKEEAKEESGSSSSSSDDYGDSGAGFCISLLGGTCMKHLHHR